MDDDETMSGSPSDSEEPSTPKEKDPNLQEGVGTNYTLVQGEKKNSRLVKCNGYLYRTRGCRIRARVSKNTTYLKCRHMTKKGGNPCHGSAEIVNGVCTVKNEHSCGSAATSQARTEAHELKTLMKKRAVAEGTTLHVCV